MPCLRFSYQSFRHFRAAAALCVVLVAVVLAAGCIGGDIIREQDRRVADCHPDKSMEHYFPSKVTGNQTGTSLTNSE